MKGNGLDNAVHFNIIGSTTIFRPQNLRSEYKTQGGGLSGKPLFSIPNEVLKNIYSLTKGKIPITAAGAISSAQETSS